MTRCVNEQSEEITKPKSQPTEIQTEAFSLNGDWKLPLWARKRPSFLLLFLGFILSLRDTCGHHGLLA